MKRQAIVLLTMTGLMVGALFALPTGALGATPQTAGKAVTVSGISIRNGETGAIFVDVATSSAPAFQVLQLANPRRLVVDFEQARNTTPHRMYAAHSPLLKGVRVGQFRASGPAVVRVVADLAGDPAFDVHAVPGGVRIELLPRELAQARKTSVPASEAGPPATVATVEAPSLVASPVRIEPAPAQEAAPVATVATAEIPPLAELPLSARREPAAPTSQPEVPSARLENPGVVSTVPVKYSLYENALPGESGSSQAPAALATATPNQTPEALRAAKAARTLAASFHDSLWDAQQAAPGGASQAEQPKYTGEPISLNLKGVDVADFFRLIHEISGLNIIVDPNVTGSVTVALEQVPWDQALDIVLKNNGLGKVLEGNVLRIAKMDTLTAEQAAQQKLAAAREEAMPLVTVFRTVNYAKPDAIATMIKGWAGGGALSKRGTIQVDARTSTLIISDIQSQIPILQDIISKLDKKAKQVVIEARVVLANSSFSRSLQAALTGGWLNSHTATGGASSGAGVVASATSTGGVTVTAPSVSGFGAAAVTNVGARYFIDAAIAAAENRNQARTISRPTIVTQNNSLGTVVQGTQIPIQTIIGTTVTTSMTAAALTLNVTPQVTEDGNVFLNINVTNNSPGPAVATGTGSSVTINTQSANTQVLVPDGGMVVFGGVTVTQRSKTEQTVPLLGSIPILGHLFKSTSVSDTDSELLFFVSPKVLQT